MQDSFHLCDQTLRCVRVAAFGDGDPLCQSGSRHVEEEAAVFGQLRRLGGGGDRGARRAKMKVVPRLVGEHDAELTETAVGAEQSGRGFQERTRQLVRPDH